MQALEYPASRRELDGSVYCTVRCAGEKLLQIRGKSAAYEVFEGRELEGEGGPVKLCPQNAANAVKLRGLFPFTAPVSHRGRGLSLGLGDRLGLASPGHLRLLKGKDVFPVLAQQSVRELKLTGRSFADVLNSATWAVFQEGYTGGFGADGDHLKTAAEVNEALENGFTMITLDCSEHIRNDVFAMGESRVSALYAALPAAEKVEYERTYLGREFMPDAGVTVSFTAPELEKIVLAYAGAVRHTGEVYHAMRSRPGGVDFEMSVDETLGATSPAAHYFVANELRKAGVDAVSLAPRFCGEFQKGIDYKGDVGRFREEFILHTKIARHFGYKLSIHSGSDKFSVFPVIGAESGGRFHLKTAGTNWLEALRVIAVKDPALFRRVYAAALANLTEAKTYYHITEDAANIPAAKNLTDGELPDLLNRADPRQVLHVTYGQILRGEGVLGKELLRCLRENEAAYYKALAAHIGRHLQELGL